MGGIFSILIFYEPSVRLCQHHLLEPDGMSYSCVEVYESWIICCYWDLLTLWVEVLCSLMLLSKGQKLIVFYAMMMLGILVRLYISLYRYKSVIYAYGSKL